MNLRSYIFKANKMEFIINTLKVSTFYRNQCLYSIATFVFLLLKYPFKCLLHGRALGKDAAKNVMRDGEGPVRTKNLRSN